MLYNLLKMLIFYDLTCNDKTIVKCNKIILKQLLVIVKLIQNL